MRNFFKKKRPAYQHGLLMFLYARKNERKAAAFAGNAFYFQLSAVNVGDLFYHGKAEAEAAGCGLGP